MSYPLFVTSFLWVVPLENLLRDLLDPETITYCLGEIGGMRRSTQDFLGTVGMNIGGGNAYADISI
jgi:hypothetical protein